MRPICITLLVRTSIRSGESGSSPPLAPASLSVVPWLSFRLRSLRSTLAGLSLCGDFLGLVWASKVAPSLRSRGVRLCRRTEGRGFLLSPTPEETVTHPGPWTGWRCLTSQVERELDKWAPTDSSAPHSNYLQLGQALVAKAGCQL